MDVLSLNYTKTTRIRSGFITSAWSSIFCFVVSTPSYIFLVFTLLVFDDLRFFFLICFFATSLLSLSVVFSSSEVTLKTRFGYGEETHRFRSRSLSLVFGKEERRAKRGARARWHLHRRRRRRRHRSVALAASHRCRRFVYRERAMVLREEDNEEEEEEEEASSDGDYEQDESRRVTAENESPPTLHR